MRALRERGMPLSQRLLRPSGAGNIQSSLSKFTSIEIADNA
jgi:hypothetical protein